MHIYRCTWYAVRTSLASVALSLAACGDSGGSEPAVDGGFQDGGASDSSQPASDASGQTDASIQTDASGPDASGSNAGIGTVCETTACPEGLTCQRPSVCANFDCDKICVRPTTSCVSDPCGEGNWCQTTLGSEAGTCEPRAAQGQDCSMPPGGDPDINTCAEGLFCSAESETDETCVPALAAGATCPTLWLGTDRHACVKGYTCVAMFGGDATCVPVKQAGESCLNHTDCAEGHKCEAQKCAVGKPGSAVRPR